MANLTVEERTKLRNFMERKALELEVPVTWVKAALNDAAQAFEDVLDGDAPITADEITATSGNFPSIVSQRINAATQPHGGLTLTGAQKKALGAKVFELKYIRDQ